MFADDGYLVGFDGSEMKGREQIEQSLSTIFADHETGRYVAEVRAERTVSDSVSMLAAITGLVPGGRVRRQPRTERDPDARREV